MNLGSVKVEDEHIRTILSRLATGEGVTFEEAGDAYREIQANLFEALGPTPRPWNPLDPFGTGG